jgi:hypothetical protein
MEELQTAYILKRLRWKERISVRAIEISREIVGGYQVWLEEKLEKTVWSSRGGQLV